MLVDFQYKEEVDIPLSNNTLTGDLIIPVGATAIVLFAHGSGSSRQSPRNRFVADFLHEAGFATLLFDLLTPQEDLEYANRFDIDLLGERLTDVTYWLSARPDFTLDIGYFGASTGAAAAFQAAVQLGDRIKAIVSRGGRPDLSEDIVLVRAPVQLIVGSLDQPVIELNEKALDSLNTEKELVMVEGATHLFEEPGKLGEAAAHAARWFARHLSRAEGD